MKTLFRAAALSALVLAGTAAATVPAAAQAVASDAAFRATTLNLSAFGEVRLAPDVATITLGVTADAPTAAEAMRANAAKMTAVIASLKRGGIAAKDIQTSNLSLSPQYVYQENLPPRLTGYQVSNQVTIVVRDLTKLGQALDTAVSAGATNVGGIGFSLDKPGAAEDEARVAAVKELQRKANLYAQSMGYRVARLVSLSESGGYAPPPPMPPMAFARAEKADMATPIEGGEVRVRMDVSGVFELVK